MSDITLVNTVLPSEVRVPPQGALYLTAALERAGFDVEIRDYQLCRDPEPWRPDVLAAFAAESAPVIGFSAMSYALPLVIEAARLVRARAPDRRIVVGGIGPSPIAAELLRYCEAIDAVVIGEGERTVVELMDRLAAGRPLSDVAGIAYRSGDGVTTTPPRTRIATMQELAPPAYERVDLTQYRLVDSQFARGCPYRCAFCDIAPFWDRRNTRRPVDHYVDELEALVRGRGARDVFIVDDTFVLNRRTILHFCAELERRGLDFEWGCYARVDLMDDELMARMASAGCRKVFYGVESGSDRVLQAIEKETTTAVISDVVNRSLQHFSFVTTSFTWGFPDETLEDLTETAFFLLYLTSLGASPQLNLALPYRYSTLYAEYRDRIRFDPEFSSQLQFYEGRDRDWICAMVRERPDLFSCFYRLPTPDFEAKWSFLVESGLSPHELQHAYDHPVPSDAPRGGTGEGGGVRRS